MKVTAPASPTLTLSRPGSPNFMDEDTSAEEEAALATTKVKIPAGKATPPATPAKKAPQAGWLLPVSSPGWMAPTPKAVPKSSIPLRSPRAATPGAASRAASVPPSPPPPIPSNRDNLMPTVVPVAPLDPYHNIQQIFAATVPSAQVTLSHPLRTWLAFNNFDHLAQALIPSMRDSAGFCPLQRLCQLMDKRGIMTGQTALFFELVRLYLPHQLNRLTPVETGRPLSKPGETGIVHFLATTVDGLPFLKEYYKMQGSLIISCTMSPPGSLFWVNAGLIVFVLFDGPPQPTSVLLP